MAHRADADLIAHSRNTARFFTETRHISWVLLIATVAWGVYGYLKMPQRKDPDIPVRVAVALCAWPGAAGNLRQPVPYMTSVVERVNPSVSYIRTAARLDSST